ncbi:rod shape-determining protein MreD [Pseudalkalibacillus berkeleyi]|uniref:Rod shape-determining protein MreD n=1 Tax=Pseudalkalibacillus berkeleyi TaxID=1069813 RepID=A0ABS9H2N9_9BACL|nr:rod shape-determining protein MreD [Pseudalkalibacillus berkeleyi]MCF6138095.1 rod shape-determining protein MreD [Pseudalkalibacillus berkeleyi]
MIRFLLPFLTYLLFISESTLMQVFTPQHMDNETIIIPRFVVIMVCFIGMYITPMRGVLYGVAFGLLYDLIFTDLIGVYMFSMGLTAYITTFIARYFHGNIFVTLFVMIIGLSAFEFLVFGLYTLIDIANMNLEIFVYQRYLPTLLLNCVFVVLVYYPLRKWLINIAIDLEEK